MKVIRAIVIAGLCVSLSGCAVLMRVQGSEELDRPTDKRFVSTRYDIGVMAAVKDANKSAEARIACLAFPFALIDLPIAFAVDTIMLPMDWHEYNKNKEDEAFWNSVFSEPDRLPTIAECCQHASVHSRFFVYDRIFFKDYDETISGESLHLIIQSASVMNDDLDIWMPLDRVVSNKSLLPASWIAIYTYLKEGKYSFLIEQLARNPVTPSEYYDELANMDDLKIKQSLTENPRTPSDILETIAQEARNSIQLEKEKPAPDTWNLYQYRRLLESAESALVSRAK